MLFIDPFSISIKGSHRMIVYPTWHSSYPDSSEQVVEQQQPLIYEPKGKIPFPKKNQFANISNSYFNNKISKTISKQPYFKNKISKNISKQQITISEYINQQLIALQNSTLKESATSTNKYVSYSFGAPVTDNLKIHNYCISADFSQNSIIDAVNYANQKFEESSTQMSSPNFKYTTVKYTTLTSNLEPFSDNFSKFNNINVFYISDFLEVLGVPKDKTVNTKFLKVEVGENTSSIIVQNAEQLDF